MQKSFVPKNLNKVIISDQVKIIPSYAFYGCKQITEIDLPAKLERIEYKVFAGCSIVELNFPITLKLFDP